MSLATWCTLLLSVKSLCQVSYALFGDSCNITEECNSTVLTFPNYYNCSDGLCGCLPGYIDHTGFCKKRSTHGEDCSSDLYFCEAGLTCQNNKCSCDLTSQYWNDICYSQPNPPGQVISVTLVQNSKNTYDITFVASIGNVNKYFIFIDYNEFPSETSSPTIRVQPLIPGRSYDYSLSAENGNEDRSEFFYGILSTRAAAPDQVSNVSLTDVTDTSVTINWQKPSSPNGNISGYIIQVQFNNICWHLYELRVKASSINVSNCQNYTDVQNFTDVKIFTQMLHYTIEKLKPYRNYTFLIGAVTEAGKGTDFSIQFLTKVGTPYMVTNVHAENITTNQNTSVGLKVTWTPGEYTGPTSYSVCLNDGTTSKCNYWPIGKDQNNLEFPNLLAYWTYNITVQAYTDAGFSDKTEPVSATTEAKIPGFAYFTLFHDQDIATNYYIDLMCPAVESRNGIITNYIISILNTNTSVSENHTVKEDNDCTGKITAKLNNIKAKYLYNISVQVQNHVYNGSFSPAEQIFVEPGDLLLPPRTLTKGLSQTTSTVKVDLCVTCILDDTQGKVVDAGLIVCLDVSNSQCYKHARKKRYATNIIGLPDRFNQTWYQSQSAKFVMQYRTTPKDWLATLKGSQLTYTIGGDDNCNSSSNNYCNGPLPSNTMMNVIIVVCTTGFCAEQSVDYLKTEGEAEPDNTPVMVGGVVGGILGLVVIVAVVVLIILVLYFKRRSKRSRSISKPDSPYDSIYMSTEYNNEYIETQGNIYNEAEEEFTQNPLDNGYIDVIDYNEPQKELTQNTINNGFIDVIDYNEPQKEFTQTPLDINYIDVED